MQNAPTAGEGEGEDAREAEAEAQDTLAELPAEEPDAVHSNPLMDADSIAKAAEKKPKFNACASLTRVADNNAAGRSRRAASRRSVGLPLG